jgi:hypothetical protein
MIIWSTVYDFDYGTTTPQTQLTPNSVTWSFGEPSYTITVNPLPVFVAGTTNTVTETLTRSGPLVASNVSVTSTFGGVGTVTSVEVNGVSVPFEINPDGLVTVPISNPSPASSTITYTVSVASGVSPYVVVTANATYYSVVSSLPDTREYTSVSSASSSRGNLVCGLSLSSAYNQNPPELNVGNTYTLEVNITLPPMTATTTTVSVQSTTANAELTFLNALITRLDMTAGVALASTYTTTKYSSPVTLSY